MTTPTDHLEKMRSPQITSVAPILPATETVILELRQETGLGFEPESATATLLLSLLTEVHPSPRAPSVLRASLET